MSESMNLPSPNTNGSILAYDATDALYQKEWNAAQLDDIFTADIKRLEEDAKNWRPLNKRERRERVEIISELLDDAGVPREFSEEALQNQRAREWEEQAIEEQFHKEVAIYRDREKRKANSLQHHIKDVVARHLWANSYKRQAA